MDQKTAKTIDRLIARGFDMTRWNGTEITISCSHCDVYADGDTQYHERDCPNLPHTCPDCFQVFDNPGSRYCRDCE